VQDRVDIALDGDRGRHIVGFEAEPFVRLDAAEVRDAAGEERVEAEDVPPLAKEPLAQMRADETGAAGHDRSRHVSASRGPTAARCRSR
jgi:hypothetical protein